MLSLQVALVYLATPAQVKLATCAMARRMCEDYQQPWDNLSRMQEEAIEISKKACLDIAETDITVSYADITEDLASLSSALPTVEEEDSRWDVDAGTKNHFYTTCQNSEIWVESGYYDLKQALPTYLQIDCVRDTAKQGTFKWTAAFFVVFVFNLVLLLAQLDTQDSDPNAVCLINNVTQHVPAKDPIFANTYVGNTRNLIVTVFAPPILIGAVVSYRGWVRADFTWLRCPKHTPEHHPNPSLTLPPL